MRKHFGTCLLLLLVTSAALSAHAQSAAERRYLVEVIIFKNVGADSSDGELWDQGFALPPGPGHNAADPPAPRPLAGAPIERGQLPEVSGVPVVRHPELVHMVDILSRLESSRRYEVLVRHAWTQPMRGRSDAITVPVGITPALTADAQTAMLYTPPAPVSGTVKMFEQRLLFVEADVGVRIPTALPSDPDSLSNPLDVEYRINETRRVKLNEVHYFDHPYFGLLVRVSRAEPAQQDPEPSPLTDEVQSGGSTQVPPAVAPPN